MAGRVRFGEARHGGARRGQVWQVWRGTARCVSVRHSVARWGMVWQVWIYQNY
nr:MAG TPA: hypothetical protein [Caudoviricetes sp.]